MKNNTSYRGITRLARNRYEVRARATDPKTGKRKDVKRIWNGSIQGALDLQRQLHDELKGNATKRARVTLGVFARSWLERACVRLRRSTAKAYADRLNYILTMLGDCYIDALRPADIEAYQSKRIADGAAGSTIRREITILQQLSRDALVHEAIDRDFCLGVKIRVKLSEYTEDDPNCLTADELTRLAGVIPEYWYALFATMAFTGMRWGEASGLRWDDIDHVQGIITVRQTNYRGTVGTPKTPRSRRLVPMEPELSALLQAHRARMEMQGHRGLETGWVFCTRKGTLYRSYPINTVLERHLKSAGITKRLTQHGLRRTFNDLLTRVVSGRVARGIMGHASVKMTDHYSFVDRQEKRTAQAAVLGLLGVARRTPAQLAKGDGEQPGEGSGEVVPRAPTAWQERTTMMLTN
jgi:integrase